MGWKDFNTLKNSNKRNNFRYTVTFVVCFPYRGQERNQSSLCMVRVNTFAKICCYLHGYRRKEQTSSIRLSRGNEQEGCDNGGQVFFTEIKRVDHDRARDYSTLSTNLNT